MLCIRILAAGEVMCLQTQSVQTTSLELEAYPAAAYGRPFADFRNTLAAESPRWAAASAVLRANDEDDPVAVACAPDASVSAVPDPAPHHHGSAAVHRRNAQYTLKHLALDVLGHDRIGESIPVAAAVWIVRTGLALALMLAWTLSRMSEAQGRSAATRDNALGRSEHDLSSVVVVLAVVAVESQVKVTPILGSRLARLVRTVSRGSTRPDNLPVSNPSTFSPLASRLSLDR